MKAEVTMKNEYRNQEWMFVSKYNSWYDVYYTSDADKDTFGFALVDKTVHNSPKDGYYIMMYKHGEFAFRKACGLFLLNIECAYNFIKQAGICINHMGLTHLINLKKRNLIK